MYYLQHFQLLHCPEIARNLSSNIAISQNPKLKSLNYFISNNIRYNVPTDFKHKTEHTILSFLSCCLK